MQIQKNWDEMKSKVEIWWKVGIQVANFEINQVARIADSWTGGDPRKAGDPDSAIIGDNCHHMAWIIFSPKSISRSHEQISSPAQLGTFFE